MISARDLYTHVETYNLPDIDSKSPPGKLIVEYEVREYTDVRSLKANRAYLVSCKQRIIVEHDGRKSVGKANSGYLNYPVMLQNSMKIIQGENSKLKLDLVEYSPKTLNATTSTSTGQLDNKGSTSSSSTQQSAGSSVSETNSFDFSVSVGMMGPVPNVQAGFSVGTSSTRSHDYSSSTGSSLGVNNQHSISTSNAMSIKDWGSYSCISDGGTQSSWVWAQDFPWSPINYPTVNTIVRIPEYVTARILNRETKTVLPPSQLSLFGINFVNMAKWLVIVDGEGSQTNETIRIEQQVRYFAGSHTLINEGDAVQVTLNNPIEMQISSMPLDLTLLALEPLMHSEHRERAVIGFSPSQFIALPGSGRNFRAKSKANNLLIVGSGFLEMQPDSPLTTDFSENNKASMTIYFKDVDSEAELALAFKHWKTSSSGCHMTISINDNTPIYRHVDTREAASGDDNVMTITLRNTNYSSADFFDYLIPGLNKIVVTIESSKDPQSNEDRIGYAIRALALA